MGWLACDIIVAKDMLTFIASELSRGILSLRINLGDKSVDVRERLTCTLKFNYGVTETDQTLSVLLS